MADELPAVEIAPTVIISNSEENDDGQVQHNSGDASDNSDGDQSASTSDEVIIASIEAERDVALASLASETERERIQLEAERIEAVSESNQELEECRRQITELTERVTNLTETVNSLIQPLPLVEEVIAEELPIVQEPDLIPQSIVHPTQETATEHSDESEGEKLEEAITRPVRRFIAI